MSATAGGLVRATGTSCAPAAARAASASTLPVRVTGALASILEPGRATRLAGPDRLVEVLRGEAHEELVAILEIDRRGEAPHLEVRPERLLGHGEPVRAVAAHLLGEGERGIEQRLVGNDARHEAEALRFGRRQLAAGEDHVEGVGGADE